MNVSTACSSIVVVLALEAGPVAPDPEVFSCVLMRAIDDTKIQEVNPRAHMTFIVDSDPPAVISGRNERFLDVTISNGVIGFRDGGVGRYTIDRASEAFRVTMTDSGNYFLEGTCVRREDVEKPDQDAFVTIPAGHFDMGSPSADKERTESEGPVHKVSIAAFALGKYEVTRADFRRFVEDSGYITGDGCYVVAERWEKRADANWRNPGFPQTDRDPVVCVNWNDAKAYTEWLSRKTGSHYRLPTEAEWEFVARAGTTTSRFWGARADDACHYANVVNHSAAIRVMALAVREPHRCDLPTAR